MDFVRRHALAGEGPVLAQPEKFQGYRSGAPVGRRSCCCEFRAVLAYRSTPSA